MCAGLAREVEMADKKSFDLESVYDEQIAPLMTQIIDICKRHSLPMAATFEYASDDFCTTTIPCDDRASDHMLRVCAAMQPRRPHVLAITETSGPDGSNKTISIRKVS